jgi:hypothetical protein
MVNMPGASATQPATAMSSTSLTVEACVVLEASVAHSKYTAVARGPPLN